MAIYNIIDYGATGNGKTDDSNAIQKAIDACFTQGGGRVLVPSGHTFLSGPFDLGSNVEFHVESGAKLMANPDESVYTESAFKENLLEGTVWIGGKDLEMVSFSGGGVIDGNGTAFMAAEQEDAFELKPIGDRDPRPHMITLVNCQNVKFRDLTFKNAAYWGLHLVGCNDVAISEISIYNNLKIRNSDGIDLDHSKNVRISNCHIESGDDCICFKNRREYQEFGPCRDITVTGCTMVSTSCAVKIGSENMDVIQNITFNNCIIKDSNRGIGIQHRDEGIVSDIVFSNMIIECRLFSDVWWGKAEPIYVTAYPRSPENHKDGGWRLPQGEKAGKVGHIKNITFGNIRCKSENGVFVGGENSMKISNIRFDDVDVVINKFTAYQGGLYDCRPCAGLKMISRPTNGFFIQNANRIFINDCSVTWGQNKPGYFGKALETENVKDLVVENFEGEDAFETGDEKIKWKINRS